MSTKRRYSKKPKSSKSWGKRRKKRRKAGRTVRMITESDLESVVSEHTRDVTEDLQEEEEQDQQIFSLLEESDSDQETSAYETLLACLQKDESFDADHQLKSMASPGPLPDTQSDSSLQHAEEEEEEEEDKQDAVDMDMDVLVEIEDAVDGDIFLNRFDMNQLEQKGEEGVKTKTTDSFVHTQLGRVRYKAVTNGVTVARLPQLNSTDLHLNYKMKKRIASEISNLACVETRKAKTLSAFQSNLFGVLNNYSDVIYTQQTHQNAAEIRETYTLHALNHVLKTRDRILKNNAKANRGDGLWKDQGFCRPKVLILLPFRHSAKLFVQCLISILPSIQKTTIANKKRFFAEFTTDNFIADHKSQDYKKTFEGNIDDCFRLGISLSRQSLKLYSEFYSSDIILASPLGLRMIVGAPGDKDRDYDFLSSIEILILDQAQIFLMQNWEHLGLILSHMNLVPTQTRDTDFSRLRESYLSQKSQFFRQTLCFSQFLFPQLNGLFSKYCNNVSGLIRFSTPKPEGTIRSVVTKIQQIFQRIPTTDPQSLHNTRFQYFISKIYPELKTHLRKHVMIYIASYFDYVRIRNYIKTQDPDPASIVMLCEYTENADLSRGRSNFFHSKRDFMLYTERLHFFRRFKIRGIKNLVFYDIPTFPQFYADFVNQLSSQDSSCLVLYTKYDGLQLERVVGRQRAKQMLKSHKQRHMFC